MLFTYQYRTKDNVLCSGSVAAPDREAVFTILRERGIRPSRVEEAPGFLNKLFGKGKRWIAIAVLALACFSLLLLDLPEMPRGAIKAPRHQIYGDPAFLEEWDRTAFASVFTHPGERLLAAFARPGETHEIARASAALLQACLTNEIVFAAGDSREVRELKMIVNGMKDEHREYLSDAKGTCQLYLRRLEERQEEERMIYLRVKNELENKADLSLWEERNQQLRAMGLKTLPRPKKK